MALVQDPLTRAVNVHWGGIRVVVGTSTGRIFSGNPANADTPFQRVDNGMFVAPHGVVGGMSVGIVGGKAVFVAIGNRGGDFFGPDSGFQIAASRDGLAWSVVFFDANVPIPGQPLSLHHTDPIGIVWDGTAFHASSHFRDLMVINTINGRDFYGLEDEGEQMYSSADGFAWAKTEKFGGWQDLDSDDDIASALASYCVKPQNSNDIPDGLQGYHGSTGTLAKPASLVKFTASEGVVMDPEPPAAKVNFSSTSGSQDVDAGFACRAVAWINGWIVAAGTGIATALPGQPFKTIFELLDDEATCVVGADRGMLGKQSRHRNGEPDNVGL